MNELEIALTNAFAACRRKHGADVANSIVTKFAPSGDVDDVPETKREACTNALTDAKGKQTKTSGATLASLVGPAFEKFNAAGRNRRA
jgi:hypothetical protein